MTCNCNRNGDVEYTIILNQQGPQGRQGNVGQNGFSPIVTVQSNTEANYQLKIISADGEIITPNLKGQDGIIPTGVATQNGNNTFRGSNGFTNTTEFTGNVLIDGADLTLEGVSNSLNVDGSSFFYSTVYLKDPERSGNGVRFRILNGKFEINSDYTTYLNDNKVITEVEFDELANDVVAINSALGGTSFKKYTEAEYASITNPDGNTLYMVTNPDGNTFKLYLGSIELEGGGGGAIVAGGVATNSISGYTKANLNNVSTTVTAEPYTA